MIIDIKIFQCDRTVKTKINYNYVISTFRNIESIEKKNDIYLYVNYFIKNDVIISTNNYAKFFNKTKKKLITIKKLKLKIFLKFYK